MGGRGFPTLMFLEEQGRVLATHRGPRTVELFKETAKEAQVFTELKAKAETGDRDAKIEYTRRCAEQGWFKLAELRSAIAGLGKLDAEQQKAFDGVLANLMVDEIRNTVEAKRYLEMLEKGLIPTEEQAAMRFYDVLVQYASYKKDVKLFERVFGELEKLLSSNPNAARYLDFRRQQLAALKAAK